MILRPGLRPTPPETPSAAPLQAPRTPLAPVVRSDDAVARNRLDAVVHAERLCRGGMARMAADTAAAEAAGVSEASVRRWRLACQGLAPEQRLAVLTDRPGRGRAGPFRDDPEARDLALALVYEQGSYLTASHVERTLHVRLGRSPSRRSIQRWLKDWHATHAPDLAAVTDPDGWKRFQPAFGSRSVAASYPNALWELDSTLADVTCADGRSNIVGVIDVWSRRAMLLVVPVSCATAICLLMRHAILAWGVPSVARTDCGADYTSRHVRRVLADLAITHDECPPYSPEAKPYIERLFGTLTRDLFAYLPGFVGHSVADRKKIEGRRSIAERHSGAKMFFECALTAEELQAACNTWCEDIYGRRTHDGLGGKSPFDMVTKWREPVRQISNERALDPLLAPAPKGDGSRVVTKTGIKVAGGTYIAVELGDHLGARVAVRCDPTDPDRIWVFAKNGAFLCVAEDPNRTGADRAEIAAKAKAAARRKRSAARAEARTLKRSQKPESAMADVLAGAAHNADRVVAFPAATRPHTTPALEAASEAARSTGTGAGSVSASSRPKWRDAIKSLHLRGDQI